jgi:hypothetical protein
MEFLQRIKQFTATLSRAPDNQMGSPLGIEQVGYEIDEIAELIFGYLHLKRFPMVNSVLTKTLIKRVQGEKVQPEVIVLILSCHKLCKVKV